jgi:hypothetical protein
MTPREKEEAKLIAKRRGSNLPLHLTPVAWDGHRSVRIGLPPKHRGLATTAYSYALTDAEKQEAAERLAALWNLGCALQLSTEQINQLAEKHRES